MTALCPPILPGLYDRVFTAPVMGLVCARKGSGSFLPTAAPGEHRQRPPGPLLPKALRVPNVITQDCSYPQRDPRLTRGCRFLLYAVFFSSLFMVPPPSIRTSI